MGRNHHGLHVLAILTFAGNWIIGSSLGASETESQEAMQERISRLENEVSELKALVKQLQSTSADTATAVHDAGQPGSTTLQHNFLQSEDRNTLDLLRDTTVNLNLDGYYAYNFNHPVGRVNLLRPYDVLSNEFSLNQANVILEHAPDVAAGRRWGARLDLQFGQATDTLQENPSNEPRPQIYRNIFQAYGTYVLPIGKGVNVDFGKWSSSLGIEGNYTKDQINYSRSYWFDFLPFYHMGVRTSIPLNDRFNVNYWLVNGTNQVEATNGFMDQLFGFTAKPKQSISWTFNYYLGQEHPDRQVVPVSSPIPVQPGLSFRAIRPTDARISSIPMLPGKRPRSLHSPSRETTSFSDRGEMRRRPDRLHRPMWMAARPMCDAS